MVLPENVMAATEARFNARQGPREDTEHRIEAAHAPGGSILDVDDPQRVALRTERIARSPVVSETLSTMPTDDTVRVPGMVRDDHLLERIIEGDNLLGIAFLDLGSAVARSVGRINVRDRFQGRGFGTGFMISPRLVLTNNHVLPDAQTARFSRMEFNFQNGVDGHPLTTSEFDLQPDIFFRTDAALDFTLVAVAPQSRPNGASSQSPLAGFGFHRLSAAQGKILLGESINIIQHPEGGEKQIALQQNELIDRLENFLHYHTDTAPGSSGSPLYNNQWEVLGLHHSGVPARNAAGDILAMDGTVWTPAKGEAKIQWIANEGIRISSILNFLRTTDGLSPEQRAMLDEVLNPPSPTNPVAPLPIRPAEQLPAPAVADPALTGDPADGAGSVSLTIPLQITVRLGEPLRGTPARTAASPRTATPDFTGTGEEAVTIDPDYKARSGYDARFLAAPVPLPVLSAEQRAAAALNRQATAEQDPAVLNYHHFSVVVERHRRLALYTVVNIDGSLSRSPKREKDKWFFDPRLGRQEQIGDDLYAGNDFDRGHLVRRLDPAWGSDQVARTANDDTFHFTNCSPQHKNFNQGESLWAGLEDYLLGAAKAAKLRLTVFTGPVFSSADPVFQGVQIPLAFWKIPVFQQAGGGTSATAFMISQRELVEGMLRESFTPATFQVPVRTISELSGLDFTHLFAWDPLNATTGALPAAREALGTLTPGRELHTFEELQLQ